MNNDDRIRKKEQTRKKVPTRLSLFLLLRVCASSVSSRSRLQSPVTGFEPTSETQENDRNDRRSSSSVLCWMEGWERQLWWEELSEEEGKERQYPWRAQEHCKESSSAGKWSNRMCERCHTETLWAPAKQPDKAQQDERCHAETQGIRDLEIERRGKTCHKGCQAWSL